MQQHPGERCGEMSTKARGRCFRSPPGRSDCRRGVSTASFGCRARSPTFQTGTKSPMRTSQRRCDIGLADLKAQCVGLPEEASLGLGTRTMSICGHEVLECFNLRLQGNIGPPPRCYGLVASPLRGFVLHTKVPVPDDGPASASTLGSIQPATVGLSQNSSDSSRQSQACPRHLPHPGVW